jgi:MFS transporter, DHA3 family, tetracycline resistance protein
VIASALLATVALSAPLLTGGVLTVALGLTLALVMPERNFHPSPREGRSSWSRLGNTARGGARLVRARPVLSMLLVIAAFSGMSGEGFDRLWAAHFLKDLGLPTLGGWIPWSGSA